MTTKTNAVAMPKATMTAKKLLSVVEGVCADSKTLQDRIHDAAVEIMLHAFNHDDFSMANTLVNGLGTGVRASALVDWFTAAGLKISEKDKRFTGMNKDKIADKFQKSKANPWYNLKVKNPFMGFDFDAELARLLKKAEKAMKEDAALTEADKSVEGYKMAIDTDKLAAVRKLLG